MPYVRTHPEEPGVDGFALATVRPRLRWPIVIAVLLAYVTIAVLQAEQAVYLLLLFPIALLAIDFAIDLADKLEKR